VSRFPVAPLIASTVRSPSFRLRAKQFEVENAELEKQAEQLAKKIKMLSGKSVDKIV
jgi:hypothetical protein